MVREIFLGVNENDEKAVGKELKMSIEQRLKKIERQLAALQKVKATPKTIRAKKFILENENGKLRAELSSTKDGPKLYMFDENGKERAILGISADGPALTLLDENGKSSVCLSVLKEGPQLHLWDENDLGISLSIIGNVAMVSMSDHGKLRAAMNTTEVGSGLKLFSENGKPVAGLSAFKKDGSSLLHMRDKNSKTCASLHVFRNGSALTLMGQNGTTRTDMGVVKNQPKLNMRNKKGKLIWSAP